jgi:hypothetical protein
VAHNVSRLPSAPAGRPPRDGRSGLCTLERGAELAAEREVENQRVRLSERATLEDRIGTRPRTRTRPVARVLGVPHGEAVDCGLWITRRGRVPR